VPAFHLAEPVPENMVSHNAEAERIRLGFGLARGDELILLCLAWYYMSSLKFQAQMGLLLALLLAFNMISALILHPAVIYRLKPRFIYKTSK